MSRNCFDTSFLVSSADEEDTEARIAACSGSSSDASTWLGSSSSDSSVKSGGNEAGAFARAFHCSFSSFNLWSTVSK